MLPPGRTLSIKDRRGAGGASGYKKLVFSKSPQGLAPLNSPTYIGSVPSRETIPLFPPAPVRAWIDPCNLCNLHCALCPTGNGQLGHRRMAMRLPEFELILMQLPTVREIELYNWGEPLLNPDLPRMIERAKLYGKKVSIHSNLSLVARPRLFEELIESGLDGLTASIDGVSQEPYAAYRCGGQVKLALDNLARLVELRRNRNSATPLIEWKFLIHRFNEHELPQAREMADKIGVPLIEREFGLGDLMPEYPPGNELKERKQTWLPLGSAPVRPHYREEEKNSVNPGPCRFLEDSITLAPDGTVFPCCLVVREENRFGNLLSQTLPDIWWGETYTAARALFADGSVPVPPVKTICSRCRNFTRPSVRAPRDQSLTVF